MRLPNLRAICHRSAAGKTGGSNTTRPEKRFLAFEPMEQRVLLATMVTFEEPIPVPDTVSTQYCNIVATHKGIEIIGGARIFEPPVPTVSGTHALTTPMGDETGSATLKIRFTTPQPFVGVKAGLDRDRPIDIEATMRAYSSNTPGLGLLLDTSTINLGKNATDVTNNLSVFTGVENIRSVEIEYTPVGGGTAFEVIDDLTFDRVGPMCGVPDAIPPSVQITTPAVDGQEFFTRNLQLAFEAVDHETGVAATKVSFLDDADNELQSFYSCGEPRRTCLYDVIPFVHTSDFLTELPEGDLTRTIRVQAWDFSGNMGQADRTIDLMLPDPDMNLWALAMEITQGIQPWLPINESRTSDAEQPPTYVYPDPNISSDAVPLVAGRKTVVRVYAGAENTGGVSVVGAEATLRCFFELSPCDGPLTIFSRFEPAESLKEVTVSEIGLGEPLEDYLQTKREDPELSWEFVLPDEWVKQGVINLQASILPPTGIKECPGCDDAANRIRIISIPFFSVPRFDELLTIVNISRSVGGIEVAGSPPTKEQFDAVMDYLIRIFPIGETQVQTQPDTTASFSDDPTLTNGERRSRLFDQLKSSVPVGSRLAVQALVDRGFNVDLLGQGGVIMDGHWPPYYQHPTI